MEILYYLFIILQRLTYHKLQTLQYLVKMTNKTKHYLLFSLCFHNLYSVIKYQTLFQADDIVKTKNKRKQY